VLPDKCIADYQYAKSLNRSGTRLLFSHAAGHSPLNNWADLANAGCMRFRIKFSNACLGYSSGSSAFRIAGRNPELFQSLTVLPGFLISTADEAALGKLIAMPITMFVGEQDTSWVNAARQTAATVNRLNGRLTLNVLPNESHLLHGLSSATLFDAIALR
jgi:hypothetical protein